MPLFQSATSPLLDINRGIHESLVPCIVEAASDAIILVVTDPPDPLADIARGLAHHDRVLSTGTYLDSLRFRVHLAQRLNVLVAPDLNALCLTGR